MSQLIKISLLFLILKQIYYIFINKTTLKVSMRSKWYTSNAPALQMALMKLISTPEELKKLSMQYVESENKHELKEFTVRVIDNNPDGNNHE